MIKKFEIGKVYYAHFASDYDTTIKVKIVGRTEKTVKYVILDHFKKEIKICKPIIYNKQECFYPFGKYSMSPRIEANRCL